MLKTATIALSSVLLMAACGTAPTSNGKAASNESAGKPDLHTVAAVNTTATDLPNLVVSQAESGGYKSRLFPPGGVACGSIGLQADTVTLASGMPLEFPASPLFVIA